MQFRCLLTKAVKSAVITGFCLLQSAAAFALADPPRTQEFAHGSVALVTAQPSLSAPGSIDIAIYFQLEEGWHVYGKEAGDIGLPTEAHWKLPAGLRVEDIRWPAPQRFEQDGLVSFGYERQAVLPTSVHVLEGATSGRVHVSLSWVLCKEECRPGETELSLDLLNPTALAAAYSPAVFGAASGNRLRTQTSQSALDGSPSLVFSLALALLGGLILNLMPCVFPIISIKILSFVNHGGESKLRLHGLLFAAGVLLSFWALAGLLLGLRAAGHELGWGFQFQSPLFVAVMALFLFALALNMAGVFEVGSGMQRWAGKIGSSNGYAESLLSGALATLLSTPCSAPFMGTAVAAALALPALHAFLIFTSLAIGMAAPYVLLTMFPALQRRMPRPGNWMVSFKQFMSFPIFGTVAWLMWVLSLQIGTSGLMCFVFALLCMSMGLWMYGRWGGAHARPWARRLAGTGTFILLLTSGYLGLPLSQAAAGENILQREHFGPIAWEPFSNSKLDAHLAAGRPVLMNFTAAWCLTCQVNHRMVYGSTKLATTLREKGVATLKGDWTNRNPEITRAIERFGKSSVPLDVLVESNGKITVFPSILTESALIEALDKI